MNTDNVYQLNIGDEKIGTMYEFYEGNHGDNYIYEIPNSRRDVLLEELKDKYRLYSNLSFELVLVNDTEREELINLCNVPPQPLPEGWNYYVLECTDLRDQTKFFEEMHILQYYYEPELV